MDKILVLALLTLTLPAGAARKKPQRSQEISFTYQKWAREMEFQLPRLMCEKTEYFRKCFAVDESGCRNALQKATASCLAKSSRPSIVYPRSNGVRLSSQVGGCAGQQAANALANRYRSIPECKNPRGWL